MNYPVSRLNRREATLLELSLLHYRTEIRARMTRYKQLIVAVALLLGPSLAAFKSSIFAPLSHIFTERGTTGAMAAAFYVALSASWAGLQRDAVIYPPTAMFTASLPLSRGELMKHDLTVFTFASSPFLILILAVFVAAWPSHNPGSGALALIGVVLASFLAQLAVARRIFAWAVPAIVSAAVIGSGQPSLVLMLMIAVNTFLLWRLPLNVPWRSGDYRQLRNEVGGCEAPVGGWIGLHWRSIYQTTDGAYRFSIIATIVLTGLTTMAVHAGADRPLRNCGLLLTHAALVTGLYGMSFATLFKHRATYGAILQALPMSRLRRGIYMMLAAELPAILLVVLLTASCLNLTSGMRITAVVVGVTAMLCGLQYLIYRHAPKHTIAASLVAGIAVVVATLQLVPALGVRPA
jgi:hypothetical protein